jgi:hypothetical protein
MKDKKHIMVIEMSGYRREIELEKPFSKDNAEIYAHIAEHIPYGMAEAMEPTTGDNYSGWAKLEVFIGGYTDYIDEDEAWVDDPWEKEEEVTCMSCGGEVHWRVGDCGLGAGLCPPCFDNIRMTDKKIYMDRLMCDSLEIEYGGKEESIIMTPSEIILLKMGTYDATHMDFFRAVGLDTKLHLVHDGLGWFSQTRV